MKKMLLILGMLLLLTGCKEDGADAPVTTAAGTEAVETAPPELVQFAGQAEVEETIVDAVDRVYFTALGMDYAESGPVLRMLVENDRQVNLQVQINLRSVNHTRFPMLGGGCIIDVPAGGEARGEVVLDRDKLALMGIAEVETMEFEAFVQTEGTNMLNWRQFNVDTSAYSGAAEADNGYKESLENGFWNRPFFRLEKIITREVFFDELDLRAESAALVTDQEGKRMILVEVRNYGGQERKVATALSGINGLGVEFTVVETTIAPGQCGLLVQPVDVLLESHSAIGGSLDHFALGEFSELELSLKLKGDELDMQIRDFATIAGPVYLDFPMDGEGGYDRSGRELYAANGLRVVDKGFFEDESGWRQRVLMVESSREEAVTLREPEGRICMIYANREVRPGMDSVVNLVFMGENRPESVMLDILDAAGNLLDRVEIPGIEV